MLDSDKLGVLYILIGMWVSALSLLFALFSVGPIVTLFLLPVVFIYNGITIFVTICYIWSKQE